VLPLRLSIAFSIVLLTGCASKIIVRPVASVPTLNGIVYALPKTVVSTAVTVKRTQQTPGVYAGYAPCFFPELDPRQDIVFHESAKIEMTDASFSSRGIPDTTQVYVIDLGAGWLTKKTLDAQLTEAGLLTSSNAEVKNEAVSFTVSTVKSAAAIAGNIFSVATHYDFIGAHASTPQTSNAVADCRRVLDRLEALKDEAPYVDARAEVDKIASEQDSTKQQKLLDESKFSRASAVFARMAALINSREQAVSAAPDAEMTSDGLKEQLAEYNDTLNQYASYFLGSTTTNTWAPSFDVVPELADKPKTEVKINSNEGSQQQGQQQGQQQQQNLTATYILFRYRPKLLSKDQPQGICVTEHPEVIVDPKFAMTEDQCKSLAGGLTVVLSIQEPKHDALVAAGSIPQTTGDRGYYYRIPDTVSVTLLNNGIALANSRLLVAQWGLTASLPANVGSSRSKYQVQLAPITGALTNFSMDSDARLEGADFTGLETASKSITDPIIAAKGNKLSKLQQDEQILEQQCKIYAIKKINDPNLDCSTVLK
jgi:hypothetical protein